MAPIAKLVPPHADKSWSFQVLHRLEEHADLVKASMGDASVKAAKPFIQGLAADWLMVEFWTGDEAVAREAAMHLAERLGLVLGSGRFTSADLGVPEK